MGALCGSGFKPRLGSRGARRGWKPLPRLNLTALGRGVFAETNLSANQIRDNIARLLCAFGLPERAFAVYLREDRDAFND